MPGQDWLDCWCGGSSNLPPSVYFDFDFQWVLLLVFLHQLGLCEPQTRGQDTPSTRYKPWIGKMSTSGSSEKMLLQHILKGLNSLHSVSWLLFVFPLGVLTQWVSEGHILMNILWEDYWVDGMHTNIDSHVILLGSRELLYFMTKVYYFVGDLARHVLLFIPTKG